MSAVLFTGHRPHLPRHSPQARAPFCAALAPFAPVCSLLSPSCPSSKRSPPPPLAGRHSLARSLARWRWRCSQPRRSSGMCASDVGPLACARATLARPVGLVPTKCNDRVRFAASANAPKHNWFVSLSLSLSLGLSFLSFLSFSHVSFVLSLVFFLLVSRSLPTLRPPASSLFLLLPRERRALHRASASPASPLATGTRAILCRSRTVCTRPLLLFGPSVGPFAASANAPKHQHLRLSTSSSAFAVALACRSSSRP